MSGTGAGYTLVHPLSQKKKVADQFEQIARHFEHMMWTSPDALFLRHVDGDRTIPLTSRGTHLCGIADGSGGLAVLVCAWTPVVLSLLLGCCLLIVLVYTFVVG